jgi:hypothetical protein
MRPLYREDPIVVKTDWTEATTATLTSSGELHFSPYNSAAGALIRNFGAYCAYCEVPLTGSADIDHIISKSTTGSLTNWMNLVLTCRGCNGSKSAVMLLWDPERDNFWKDFKYRDNHRDKIDRDDLAIFIYPKLPGPTAFAYIDKLHLNNRPAQPVVASLALLHRFT